MTEEEKNPNRKYSYALMVAHICDDINQGALLAALPFLVIYSGFSYTEVALLVFAANMASSVIQPLFGWLGDKKERPWIMAAGVFLAGAGMAGVGLFTDYALIITSAMVSGIGVAMFHPEAGRLANLVAGKKKAGGMSIFSVGGNIGFSLGPIMTAGAMTVFGIQGTFVFLIHSSLCAIMLLALNSRFKQFGLRDKAAVEASGKDQWGLFSMILGVLSFRSILFNTLLAFVPLFLVGVLGTTEAFSSLSITAYSIVGACATLMSGRISEKTGTIKLLTASMFVLAVIMISFMVFKSVVVTIILLMIAAIAVNAPYPSTVALGQSYVPRHLGMVSGLTYGVAVSIGGAFSPVMGMVGDSFGLTVVFAIATVIAFVGAGVGILLAIKHRKNYGKLA